MRRSFVGRALCPEPGAGGVGRSPGGYRVRSRGGVVVKHIVFWRLKPTADGRSADANASEIKGRLEALNGRIPGLIRLEVGIDISRTEASADVALYSEFVDQAALEAYQVHPEHVAVAGFVAEVRDSRVVVDYITGIDPESEEDA